MKIELRKKKKNNRTEETCNNDIEMFVRGRVEALVEVLVRQIAFMLLIPLFFFFSSSFFLFASRLFFQLWRKRRIGVEKNLIHDGFCGALRVRAHFALAVVVCNWPFFSIYIYILISFASHGIYHFHSYVSMGNVLRRALPFRQVLMILNWEIVRCNYGFWWMAGCVYRKLIIRFD